VLIRLRQLLRRSCGQEGSAAVEFALCLIPLLLIVAGIVDFGESWYMSSVLATASREGARYATRYQTNPVTGARLIPNALVPTIPNYVITSAGYNLTSLLPSNAAPEVPTPTGSGYTTGTAGLPVSVKVTAKKYWLFLNHLVPGLTNPQVIASTTTMACE
jgi:Flp pilus assembly protein TadG